MKTQISKKRVKKNPLYICGMTEDGRQVISGLFKLVDEQGIHLTTVLDHLVKNDLIPNWIDFLQNTIDSNWRLESTLEKISHSCFEVYGPEHRDIVINKAKFWIINCAKF